MRPRNLVFITLLAVCHLRLGAQAAAVLTNAVPSSQSETSSATARIRPLRIPMRCPTIPARNWCPLPSPSRRLPPARRWSGRRSASSGPAISVTLTGNVVVPLRGLCASRRQGGLQPQATTELEADGHLQVTGGPNDVLINATHGDMRLNMHTARFYNVSGSQGVRTMGHTVVYSTPNPAAVFRPRAAGDGRGQIQSDRRLDHQLPASAPRLADHRACHQPRQRKTHRHRMRSLSFSGCPDLLPSLSAPPGERNGARERTC